MTEGTPVGEVNDILEPGTRATRGSGFLEPFLAHRRYLMAQSLIPSEYRKGCIVDIGCGTRPLFLAGSGFVNKIGLDKDFSSDSVSLFSSDNFRLIKHDLEKDAELPLEGNCCNAVTMLAVIEHLNAWQLPSLFAEVFRILKPGGICIVTTPASWTDGLLGIMSKLNLVSSTEIHEHKGLYDRGRILEMLMAAGFPRDGLRSGYFELGLNIWISAMRS